MRIRLGTRGSQLARIQTGAVASRLERLGHEVETVVVRTTGDRVTDRAFSEVGAPGLFVREIEAALAEGRIDLAVHSYKDLPSRGPKGLVVVAVPERLDPADRLLANASAAEPGAPALPLRRGARLGTASARREALLRRMRPDLELTLLRGNLPTRIRRVLAGEIGATLLAAAGLERMARGGASADDDFLRRDGIVETRLDPAVFVPAPSQGAIALQARADDRATRAAVEELDDADAHRAVRSERALLERIEGDCTIPFGAWCRAEAGALRLTAFVARDGTWREADERGDNPLDLAERAARALLGGAR